MALRADLVADVVLIGKLMVTLVCLGRRPRESAVCHDRCRVSGLVEDWLVLGMIGVAKAVLVESGLVMGYAETSRLRKQIK